MQLILFHIGKKNIKSFICHTRTEVGRLWNNNFQKLVPRVFIFQKLFIVIVFQSNLFFINFLEPIMGCIHNWHFKIIMDIKHNSRYIIFYCIGHNSNIRNSLLLCTLINRGFNFILKFVPILRFKYFFLYLWG